MSGVGLFLLPEWPWPPTSGGRLRAASIAAVLDELVRLVPLAAEGGDAAPPGVWADASAGFAARHDSLLLRIKDLLTALRAGRHVALQRAISSGMVVAFEGVLRDERPSFVVCGRGFGGPFMDLAKRRGAAVFVDADESLIRMSRSVLRSHAPLRGRARAALDLFSAGRAEAHDFASADEVWFSTLAEASRYAGRARVRVVPNVAPAREFEEPGPVRAVAFVGYYRHPPNEEAAVELATSTMPAIRRLGGPRRLFLIGREPSRHLIDIGRRDPDIVLTGSVEDVAPILRDAGVLAMPIRSGGGSRIKALEAAALGIPIVSTAFGMEGLAFSPGRDFLLAETPLDFAEAIHRLAQDSRLRVRLARSARAVVESAHSRLALSRVLRSALEERAQLRLPAAPTSI